MKKNLLLFLLIIATSYLSAQLIKEKEIVVAMGPSAAKLVNSNINKDEYKTVDKQVGFNFNFSYNRYFKNRVGIGVGLGFSNYKQTVYQKGLFIKPNQTDQDGYVYDLWMKSDMTYIADVKYIDVPVILHLLMGNSDNFYGFIDAGIVNSFLVNEKYTKKGSIENMGAYPSSSAYFYLVSHSNSYYNHKVQSFDKTETEDVYKLYNASLKLAMGLAAKMTERLFFRTSLEVIKGFSDITGKDNKGKDYENVFGDKSGYKPTTTFSFAINVGFAFNL